MRELQKLPKSKKNIQNKAYNGEKDEKSKKGGYTRGGIRYEIFAVYQSGAVAVASHTQQACNSGHFGISGRKRYRRVIIRGRV